LDLVKFLSEPKELVWVFDPFKNFPAKSFEMQSEALLLFGKKKMDREITTSIVSSFISKRLVKTTVFRR